METISVVQKATPSGWLVISSFIMTMCLLMHQVSCRVFGETCQITQVTQPPKAQIWCPATLAFPKTKIIFEREEISDNQWDAGKYNRATDGDWVNFVRFQGASFEGDGSIIVLCTMFLVSCILFHKCLYFSYWMAGYFLNRYCHIVCKYFSHSIHCHHFYFFVKILVFLSFVSTQSITYFWSTLWQLL